MSSLRTDISVPGRPEVCEVSAGIYAYVQPDGTWWINNTGFLVGPQGVISIDSCATQRRTLAYLEAIAAVTPAPVRTVVNTHHHGDHTFGNCMFPAAAIVAHENVLQRMSDAKIPFKALPTETYYGKQMKLSHFFNGEGIRLSHFAGVTDGDSLVYFRTSDVISSGEIFSPENYPLIDLQRGGSVQGLLEGLNYMLDLIIPEFRTEGGTFIIPAHGRVSDNADVAYYRDMVTIIRDRVQAMLKKGMTLEQVKAARPTEDWDGRLGKTTGPGTTDMFVEAVFKSLAAKK